MKLAVSDAEKAKDLEEFLRKTRLGVTKDSEEGQLPSGPELLSSKEEDKTLKSQVSQTILFYFSFRRSNRS